MSLFVTLIEQYGLIAVFCNVLLAQLGIPVPAYPALIIAGALLQRADYHAGELLFVSVCGALIADIGWYVAGKKYGVKIMAQICRISLSPDSCVRQTAVIYSRWGAASLLVAKFIPGFASIGSALAGVARTRLPVFIVFDGVGALLWAGVGIYLGTLFSATLGTLLGVLARFGMWGMALAILALSSFIGHKWLQRHRLLRTLRMARITVEELHGLQSAGVSLTVLDVRPLQYQQAGRIPGAIPLTPEQLQHSAAAVPLSAEVVVYCACPNEVSAARVAKRLMQLGVAQVRPLSGGIEAWTQAGLPLAN